ncbi:hypothetical protein HaLaN_20786, partial [Haematococcus lacustris]
MEVGSGSFQPSLQHIYGSSWNVLVRVRRGRQCSRVEQSVASPAAAGLLVDMFNPHPPTSPVFSSQCYRSGQFSRQLVVFKVLKAYCASGQLLKKL